MKKFKYIIIFLFFLVYSLNLFSQKIVSINDGIKANEIEILEEQIKVKGNFGILVNSTNVSCYGLCDGKITIFITGGSPVYPMQVRLTYPPDLGGGIVFFNNLQQTDFPFTITGLCGSQSQYLIRVRDADGHNSYSQASIMAPAQMFIDDYTITDESCNGSCNGSIEIEFVYNANYPIQYVWSSGETGSSSGNPFGIHSKCGGTYYVTITDNSGCTEDFEYTITSPTLLKIDSVKYTSVICSQGTGQITIYASGGTPPYYYDIGTGFQISNTYNNLNSGTYTITVADNMWCITTYGPITIQLNPAFTLSETHTNVQCYNYNNGSINLTVNGGTPPYSYLWSNGATTEDLNNLSPGIYTVTVTDASTCTATLSITITSPPPLTVTETHTNVTCYNGSNGSITLSVSGGTPGYSYTWTGPSCPCAGPNLTNIKAGTYNVTVTDANGCTKTLSINITQPPAIIVNATKQDATCYNTCNGWINLTITGGTPGYTFNWTGPFGYTSTNEDIYNLCAGWYYVTITDAAGCTAQRSFNIASPPAINVNFTNVVNPTCNGYCNGSFNTIISGGTPPYTYAWSGPSCPCSGLNLSNLCAGTYTITVTDFRGCTKIAQRTLVDPPGMSLSETHVNVNCYGQNTGSINLTVSGSYSLPLSYMWTGPNGYSNTAEDISNLYAGTYTVTVTEGGGCTKTLSVNITENNKLLVNAIVTNVSCAGANNGSINITVSGGNQPYSYQWIGPNGFNSTNEDISNLAVGTYNLTVNDVLGCTKDTSFNVSETTPITIIDSIINVKCYNTYTGSIYITVNGGNPPYSYQWQGPNGFSSTNEDIINLQAGNYFLTISDAANCSKTASFNVTQPSNFVFSEIHQNVLCYGNTDGWINISVTGATPPYSFNWQGPNGFSSTNEDIFNLTQGDYYLTITDQNSCTYTTSITINSNIQLIITETHNNLTCYNNNSGNINISVNGGTPPYFYNWNNGATTEDLVNLPAGTYKVTVTDSNGCKDSLTIVLTQPSDLYYTSLVNPPLCFGNCNGNAVITANGGTPPYTIIINGCLDYFASGNSPLNLTNLCDCGINGYNIQIIDNNGCIKDTMLTITAPLLLNVTITGVTYNNCSINCDATASASYSGGTAPISLTWSNGQTGNTATNLCAGWVYVTAQDANGCKDVDSIQITSPNPVNLNITNIQMSCYSPITGQALGNGIYVPDGPNCPQQCYNATIDVNFFPPGATVQSISDIQSICIKMEHSFAGDLSFKIKCPNNQSVFLDSFDHSGGAYLGQANDYDCLSCNTNPTNCPQGIGWNYCWSQIFPQQGLLNVLDGGVSPIPPVNFNNNTNYFTPENSLSGLIGCPLNGTWTLEVCDNWLIDDGWLFSWQINFNPVLYNVENCNGSATVVPNGGTPPYSYQWSNGDNTPTTDSLCAGTYFVTVSDANGCSNTSSVTIQAINVQITSISKTNAACSGICNGSATVNYTGGLNPTTITWSNGQTTATINNLCAGWYYVTVESYGCKDIDSVQITNGYTLNVQHNITNQIKCFGNCDGSAIVFATNGTPPYSYNPSAILTNKCAGAYTVTVTDANGCSNTTTVNFVQPPALNIDSIKKNNIQPCYGNNNGSITIYVSGGVPPYLYNIGSGNQSSNTFTNLAPGVYTVTITDANNCTKVTNPITIVQPPQLVIDSITKTNVFPCYGNSNGTITVYVSGGVSPYLYNIGYGAQTSNVFSGLNAGTYQITITDNLGCSISTTNITITQPDSIQISFSNIGNVDCHGACNGFATVQVVGGTPGYTYQWSASANNQTTQTAINLCGGAHFVTITDANGCTNTNFVLIQDTSNLQILILSKQDPTCYGDCNGSISITAINGYPPYSYLWDNGSTNPTRTNLCAGTYFITVTDDSLCIKVDAITLINPPLLNASLNIIQNINCYNQCSGVITANVNGGVPPYTYTWNTGSLNDTIYNLCTGFYYATISDNNGCTIADTIFLPQPTAIINTFNITNSIKCFGNCDGVITATTLGGIPPYNYTWSNGQNTNTATNVCSGYTYLTITDNNGCTKIDSVFMSQPDSLTLQFTTIPAACSGVCEGIITVTVSGGTPSYNYLWSNGDIVSTADSLCAGNYTITVTDANGCTKVDTIQVPDTSSLNLLVTNIISPTCYGTCNGQIIVSATGGTQPYFFMWNTGQSGNTISNLCAGIYTVTLTDANNCTRTATVNLTEPQQLNDSIVIAHPISCYNFCDGEIAVYPFGGTPPYMIHLNGIINPDLSHLCAGTYQLIIIDANGCTKIDSVTILQPQQLSIIINITEPIKCFGNCNGIVQATVNGGNLPYFYNWSNGDNTNTADSLCAGILTLTVTDNNNCIKKDSILITQPNPLTIDFTNVTATTCGKCVGSATAMVSGGTQPYTYQWDANANNQTTATADSLCVNIYFVTATDANGCTTVNNIAIIDTSNLTINVTDLNHITCAGWCNGSATVEASGGYPPYVFLWSNGQTTATATNLCAGTYFVTVTDDSLCSRVEMIEITDQNILTVNANITPVACAGMCNAQIVLVPQGGTPPYASYQWSISGLSDSVAHDLCPGMYYFTVTDSNGCQYSDTVIIEDQPPMQVLINVVSPIKCNGDCNGVLLVQVIGAYGYNILWSTNDTTDTIAGLCFGNYSVTITGQGSCIDSTNIYLTQPEPLNISFVNIAQVGCHGDCSGQVTAVVNGGTAPYTYQWGETANFATTPNIDSLCANLYFITITDNNSCTKTSYIEITDTSNLQLLIVDSANIRCYGNCDGWIEVQAQGGYPPYNYIWFTQPPQTGNIINNLCAGQYIVKVVDDSLCSRSRLIQLTQPDSLYIVYLMKPPLCYSDSNGYITITINGGVMPYSILWNTGSTDTTLTNLTGGNYSVTITDANNCSITDTLSLIEPNLILDSVKLKYPLCNNFDTSGAIYITNIIGGTPPYTVKWNIGILSDSIVNIGAGVYYYTITDANNCNKTDSVILNSLITVNAIAIPDTTICYGDSVQIFGFGGKEFYWTPGSTLSDSTIFNPYAKPLNSTTYYYIAYDSICFDIDSVFVGIYPTVTVNAGENQTIIYDQITNISGTISGTVASYYWTPSKWLTDSTSLTTTAHPFETIVYYLVAITPEGCKFKDSVKINVLPRLRIPTGITPNGDGINDVWIIDLIEKFPNCEVMIFNRWGEQLFYSKGYPENERWDGTYKGKPLPAGTYYYVILLHDEAFPDPLTGPITIKR